jgi:hypothetical protein
MSWFKVVRVLATPAPRFAPLATPAPPILAGVWFPPASCWFDPTHRPPHPGCGCGYHGFTDRVDAVRYVEQFSWPSAAVPPHRFLVRCTLPGALPVGTDDSTVRAATVRVDAVLLPPRCRCGRRAAGVRVQDVADATDPLDRAATHPLLVAACVAHRDVHASAQLAAFVPIEPYM